MRKFKINKTFFLKQENKKLEYVVPTPSRLLMTMFLPLISFHFI